MEKKKVLRQIGQSAAVAALVCSGGASAIGLGEISVDSGLNERLAASIPLLSPTPGQRDSLTVHVANADDFQRAGLEWQDYFSTLRFRLLDTPSGTRVVIDSDERVREPFMTIIVEARWAGGRLLREYSMLFDPPAELGLPRVNHAAVVAQPAPAAATTSAAPSAIAYGVPRPTPVVTATRRASDPAASRPAPAPSQPVQVARPPAPKPATPVAYGPVHDGEQPRVISAHLHYDSAVTVEQVELALYRANPAAFAGGRLDHIVPGAMLKVPSLATVQAEPAAAARATILAMRAKLKPAPKPQLVAVAAPAAKAVPPAVRQPATPPQANAARPAAAAVPTVPVSVQQPAPAVMPAPAPKPAASVAPVPAKSAPVAAPAVLDRRGWSVMLWVWSAAFLLLGLGATLLALLRGRQRAGIVAAPRRTFMPIEPRVVVPASEPVLPTAAIAATAEPVAAQSAPVSEAAPDPIADEAIAAAVSEAEICQLYGHFAEGARILADVAARAPADKQLRVKLAEAYLAAGMREAFERTMAELRGHLDAAMAQRLERMAA